MAFLDISGLHKRFGSVDVLKGIDLDLDKGGFLVLVGPSGCGKSTLLHMIAGLETVTSGEVRLEGEVINDLHPSKRDIAMVFQSYALYPNMTVAENIGFALEMRGIPPAQRETAVKEAARTLQIEHLLGRRPGQLSGGQRQRVAMGRALVRKPRLFLFDEPLSNLDAKLRVDMRTEIKRLHHRTGATIVYVTHDQIEAMTLATKIAVMKEGVLQQVGTPSDIYNRPANLFVADFMGSPAMNLLEAEVAAGGANEPRLTLRRNGAVPITLRVPESKVTPGMSAGAKVILGIRPEAITDEGSADRSARTLDTVDVLVDVVEPAGSDTLVVTTIAGKEVFARLRADAEAKPGDMLPLVFNLDKAVYFDPETGTRLQ
jgi:multiple sugar transport system ATP-binding protein